MAMYICVRTFIQYMYVCVHVFVSVCTCVYIGQLRISNQQPQTKLPDIAATKCEALPVKGGCPRRGKH